LRFPGKVNFSLIANRSATLRSALVALRPQLLACVACLPFLSVMADSQDAAVAGEVRSQASSSSTSDTANASELTLQDAVQKALTTYPTVRIALERALAARAQVGLVRTQTLPQASVLWQTNRSTYNNIPGLLISQGVVPSLSGPVLANTSGTSVWGSAGGLLINWEPTRFGYRKAEVDAASDALDAAGDRLSLTKLDVANAAASAYIAVAVVHEQVRSAESDLTRRQTFADTIHILVDNQLRPGADASQADAEVAAAKTRLIRSRTAEKTDLAALAELLVVRSSEIHISSDTLLTLPAEQDQPSFTADRHPLALESNHLWNQSKAEERVWSRAYAPRIALEGAVSGRGSGVKPDGTMLEGTNGLAPDRALGGGHSSHICSI
jgi:outer membrane protein